MIKKLWDKWKKIQNKLKIYSSVAIIMKFEQEIICSYWMNELIRRDFREKKRIFWFNRWNNSETIEINKSNWIIPAARLCSVFICKHSVALLFIYSIIFTIYQIFSDSHRVFTVFVSQYTCITQYHIQCVT